MEAEVSEPCGSYLEFTTAAPSQTNMFLRCERLLTLTDKHVLQYACVIKAYSELYHTPVKEAAWGLQVVKRYQKLG